MNLPKCKPGDLCLVLGKFNNGKVVTAIKIVPKEEVCKLLNVPPDIYDESDIFWEVDKNLAWGFYECNIFEQDFTKIPYCLDHKMLPINGNPDKEEEKDEIEQNQPLSVSA